MAAPGSPAVTDSAPTVHRPSRANVSTAWSVGTVKSAVPPDSPSPSGSCRPSGDAVVAPAPPHQLAPHVLDLVVAALAEVVEAQGPVAVDDVLGRPVAVAEGVPDLHL